MSDPVTVLHLDVIFNSICLYLELSDLRACMSVSRSWFHTFIADGAFAHFKRRFVRACVDFQLVFDEHPWCFGDDRTASSIRPSKGKKRRKAWIMPKGGTWYVMKRFLHMGCTTSGIRRLENTRGRMEHTSRMTVDAIYRCILFSEKDQLLIPKGVKETNAYGKDVYVFTLNATDTIHIRIIGDCKSIRISYYMHGQHPFFSNYKQAKGLSPFTSLFSLAIRPFYKAFDVYFGKMFRFDFNLHQKVLEARQI